MSPQTGFLVSPITLINSWESQINGLAKSSRRFSRHHNPSVVLNVKHIIQRPLETWHELSHLSEGGRHGFVSCYSYSSSPLLFFMVKMTLGSLEQSPVKISLGNSDGKVPIFLKSVVQVVKEVPLPFNSHECVDTLLSRSPQTCIVQSTPSQVRSKLCDTDLDVWCSDH